ncbi:MAG: hypothetical protein Q9167_006589 [Letrouitia subvulpina]
MSRFDKVMAEKSTLAQPNGHSESTYEASTDTPETLRPKSPPTMIDGTKRGGDEDLSDVFDTTPAKKKRKRSPLDEDAAFAARLQAEENSRARPTRGGGPKKSAPVKKKTPKKKTTAKVKAEDDSDVDDSDPDNAEKKVNRSGGFHKPLTLSAPLSALLNGELQLSRPQTVKRIWAYVHEHDLQDPNDKRWIRCDNALRAVFKQEKIHMFTMNKVLAQNLYNPDE